MKSITKIMMAVIVAFGLNLYASEKVDGVLIVGTQAKVKQVLSNAGLSAKFNNKDESAMAAVRISQETKCLSVYEAEAAEKISEFLMEVGYAAEDGIILTVQVGTGLWNFTKNLTSTSCHIGKSAFGATVAVVRFGGVAVVDGTTFVVKTSVQVVAEVLSIPVVLVLRLFGL